MSLLKRLLGLGGPENTPKAAPPIQRAPRVSMNIMHNLKFLPQDPPFAQEVGVANVSLSGVGLYVKNLRAKLHLNQNLSGKLSVEGIEMPVSLQVKQELSEVLGCAFQNLNDDLEFFLKSYFEIELEVFSLVTQMHTGTGSESFHLTGSPKVSLWATRQLPGTGVLGTFRVSFFGSYFEGGTQTKARYGSWVTGDQIPLHSTREQISAAVHWENHFPKVEKEKLLKVISYAPELSPEERKFIKSEINKVP